MLQQDISRAVRAALLEDLGDALTALDQPDASADITAQLIRRIASRRRESLPARRASSAASPGSTRCLPSSVAK